jgi:hypothetical protein
MAKEYVAVEKSTTLPIVPPTNNSTDVLTGVLRDGAKHLLAEAIQIEVADWTASHSQIKDLAGHCQVVRNGYLPEWIIQTGLGGIPIQQPRVHDRRSVGERIKFTSSILPPYPKRTKSLDELLPWLYLKVVSTGDFSEALAALLSANAPGLLATTISRLKAPWEIEFEAWNKHSLKGMSSDNYISPPVLTHGFCYRKRIVASTGCYQPAEAHDAHHSQQTIEVRTP